MRNFGIETVLALAAAVVASPAVHAQTADAGSLFGQGAHAYFSGNSSRAESYLSSALALNPDDPRLYYFRGLALVRLGRGDEARGDMLAGAKHEARQPGRYAVGMALQRVQGAERLLLEQFRRQARADAQQQRRQLSQTRFEQSSVADDRVLHRPITVSLDEFLPGTGPRLSAAGPLTVELQPSAPAADARPVSSETAAPASQPTPPQPPATTGDPFIDDPAPEAETSAAAETPPSDGAAADPAANPNDADPTDPFAEMASDDAEMSEQPSQEDESLLETGDDGPSVEQ